MAFFKRLGRKGKQQSSDHADHHAQQPPAPSLTPERQHQPRSDPVTVSPPATAATAQAGGSIFSGLTFSPAAPSSTSHDPAQPVHGGGDTTVKNGESEAGSGFGFLNQGTSPVGDGNSSEPGSSFSFISSSNHQHTSQPSHVEEEEKDNDGGQPALSSFSFISPSDQQQTPGAVPAEEDPPNTESGFGFLSQPTATESQDTEHQQSDSQPTTEQAMAANDSSKQTPSLPQQRPSPSQSPLLRPSSSSSSSPRPVTPQQRVQRQAPPERKKIKRKAARPGQARASEPVVGSLVDVSDTAVDQSAGEPPPAESRDTDEQTHKQTTTDDSLPSSEVLDISVDAPSSEQLPASPKLPSSGSAQPATSAATSSTDPGVELDRETQVAVDEPSLHIPSADSSPHAMAYNPSAHIPDNVTSSSDTVEKEEPSLTIDHTDTAEENREPTSHNDESTVTCLTTTTATDSTSSLVTSDTTDTRTSVSDTPTVTAPIQTAAEYTLELTSTERLETTLQVVESNLSSIRSSLEEVDNGYQSSVEELLAAVHQQIRLRLDVKQLKAEETTALSEENYELAEELNKKMEAVVIEPEWKIAERTHKIFSEWACQCRELLTNEVSLLEQLHETTTQLKDEQGAALASLEKELSSSHAKEKAQLQTMMDKLQREKGLIALDREHLEKREQLLQDEENQRAAEFLSRRQQLQEEHKSIEEEILDLEAKLRELREHQHELEQQIDGENEKIQQVADELAVEKQLFDKEKTVIEEKERKLQLDENKVNKSKEQLQANQKKQNSEIQRMSELMDGYLKTLQTSSSRKELLQLTVADEDNVSIENISHLLKPSTQLNSLADRERQKDAEVKHCTAEVLARQNELTSLHKRIADCDAQIPKLQDSKKTAVNARQFREAKRIAEEVKNISERVAELKTQVTASEEELGKLNESLSQLSEELTTARQERMAAEQQHDVECIEKLASKYLSVQTIAKRSPDSPFYGMMMQCTALYKLLVEDLCAKHDLTAADYLPSNATTSSASLVEERTPGVGMENSSVKEDCSTRKQQINDELRELENKISKAVENEDYDRAAELDEEQNKLKKQLEMLEM